jgi:hypothetical protein
MAGSFKSRLHLAGLVCAGSTQSRALHPERVRPGVLYRSTSRTPYSRCARDSPQGRLRSRSQPPTAALVAATSHDAKRRPPSARVAPRLCHARGTPCGLPPSPFPRCPIGAPPQRDPALARELVTRHRGWRRPQGSNAHRGAGASPGLLPHSETKGQQSGGGPAPNRRSFAAPTTPAGTCSQPRTPHAACHGSSSQSSAVARSPVSSLNGAPCTPGPRRSRSTAFRPVAHPLREENRRRRRRRRAIGRGRCGGRAPSAPPTPLDNRPRR